MSQLTLKLVLTTKSSRATMSWSRSQIAITAVLDSEGDDVGGQCRLIIAGLRDLALRRAMLAQNTAGKPLGDAVLSDHTLHASTVTRGA